MRRIISLATVALLMTAMLTVLGAGTAVAHVHVVENPDHTQELANGQNHPGFVSGTQCEGVNEPENSGPAGYGLETAHHGPDAGTPGNADGCYATTQTPPPDNNPAID
jgi:hypothetical protein